MSHPNDERVKEILAEWERQRTKMSIKHRTEPSVQRISDLGIHLDHWESQGHTTVGIEFLRRHFGIQRKKTDD